MSKVVHYEIMESGWFLELCNKILKANPICTKNKKKVTCPDCLAKLKPPTGKANGK